MKILCDVSWLLINLSILICLPRPSLGEVTVKFSERDYGYLNETQDAYADMVIEKHGQASTSFAVIVELDSVQEDFKSNSWTVYFPVDGQDVDSKVVKVFVNDDDIPEDNETFRFHLRVPSADVTVSDPEVATLTIPANDDAHGIISINEVSPISVQEVARQNKSFHLFLTRDRGAFGDVEVNYKIKVSNQSTAEKEDTDDIHDLFPVSGKIIIEDGLTSADFEIFVNDDEIPENDEFFSLSLTSIDKGRIDNNHSSIEIIVESNDSPIRFTQSTVRATEKDSVNVVDVHVSRGVDETGENLIGPDIGEVVVNYQVLANTATRNSDYNVENGTVRFPSGEYNATIKVFIMPDTDPEVAENFTIELLPDTVYGDAIVTSPDTCVVTIETNDKANGVLSISLAEAVYNDKDGDKKVFIVDEDNPTTFPGILIQRLGGSFKQVSIEWALSSTNERTIDKLTPESGTVIFEPGETEQIVKLNVTQDEIPQEAAEYVFSLLPDTLKGGAELEGEINVKVYVRDSDDVYGVINIQRGSSIEIDNELNERYVLMTIERSGGETGKINVTYSAHYLPPSATDIRDSMPGILEQSIGNLLFDEGIEEKEFRLKIEESAFLQTGASFEITLGSIDLYDRVPLVSPHTPRLGERSTITLRVNEEQANSKVGFADSDQIDLNEPTHDEGPLTVELEITREGLSSETVIQLSYRNDVVQSMEVTRDVDYVPGRTEVKLLPGQRSVTVTLTILPDDEPEVDEILVVRIDSVEPDNQKIIKDSSEKRILILENDSPGGIFQFSLDTPENFEIEENENEAVALTVIRTEGDLATRMLEYDVSPNGSAQFYGVPEILVFEPGQRIANISIVPKDDDIPELLETFTLQLKPYGNPPSVLADRSSVQVTVKASDDPHGVFVMAERDDENNLPGRTQNILESTKQSNYSCFYVVNREMGSYGEVSVAWKIIPEDTNDALPTNGILTFDEGITEAIIDLWSRPDDLPESMEEFSVILYDATNGSRVGSPMNATFIIDANDRALFFEGPNTITIAEGEDLVLNVHREGPGSDSTNVQYKTRARKENDEQSEMDDGYIMRQALTNDDYKRVPDVEDAESDRIHFPTTSLDQQITIPIFDDDIPEDNEEFFIEIFNATGDYVVNGNTIVQVKILHNDDSYGVFSLSSQIPTVVKEGFPEEISVQRGFGHFRDIEVKWKIVTRKNFHIGMTIEDIIELEEAKDDFEYAEGVIEFQEDEDEKIVVINPLKDDIPEYEEDFIFILTNVSDSARLSSDISSLMKNLSIAMNDYPYGKIQISEKSLQVNISEDFENQNELLKTHEEIHVERKYGADGKIKVLWELYNAHVEEDALPICQDLLLSAEMNQIESDLTLSRQGSGTPAYKFQKESSAECTLNEDKLSLNSSNNFALSLWIKPDLEKIFSHVENTASEMLEVVLPLIVMYDETGLVYSLYFSLLGTSYDDISFVELVFKYRNETNSENQITLELSSAEDIFQNSDDWKHIVFNIQTEQVTVYINNEMQTTKNLSFGRVSEFTRRKIYIGKKEEDDQNSFTGYLQDVRYYEKQLTTNHIKQLYELPAQFDLRPISGILEYGQGEDEKLITIHSIDDDETEFNENFYLILLDTTNGASVNSEQVVSDLTILKSDNANGLFGFYQSCEPKIVEEGGTVTCYINRTRGTEGSVTVNWIIDDLNIRDDDTEISDFEHSRGSVMFAPDQLEATFTLQVSDDTKPEITESHDVILESAISHDGVSSSTSFSGASVDKDHEKTSVKIKKGDRAHGVLQFSDGLPPEPSDQNRVPVRTESLTVHIEEEQSVVSLLIVRAAGWHGDVTVEWRTRDGTAISSEAPKDFSSAAGILNFKDGEGYKFINITVLDDEEPELEKSFYVDLLTPTGGAEVNEASHAEIIIAPSDNAYGVYQFVPESLSVIVEEPKSGKNTTKLQVKRTGGNLGRTVLIWKVKDNEDGDLDQSYGEVIFEFGQRDGEVEISVVADEEPEFTEHFIVELVNVSHGVLGGSGSLVALVTVPANDDPYGVVVFKQGAISVNEGNNNATLTVNRIGGLSGVIRVHYKTIDPREDNTTMLGIATPDRDFTAVESSLLFNENVTSASFTVSILEDELPETDEEFFVQLTYAELVPSGTVLNSPRLGTAQETMIGVIINKNDSPHGVLELSSTSVLVDEEWTSNEKVVVDIVRKLGTFGEITVGVTAIQGDALPDEDYSLSSREVTFLDGEDRKPFPVDIINDFTPEQLEFFSVQLIRNSITGEATLGDDTTCRVTIEKSDYPYGALEISVMRPVVSEPESGESGTPVEFTVRRKGGLLGIVAVKWIAIMEASNNVISDGPGSADHEISSGSGDVTDDAITDIDVTMGTVYFVSNENEKTFTVKVMPDDIPENDEVVAIKLDHILRESMFTGVINRDRDVATFQIPANDHPYGIVGLEHNSYQVEESDDGSTELSLNVIRSGGLFGTLRVVYSTEEVDLISESLEKNEDIVSKYFEIPVSVTSQVASSEKQIIDLTSHRNPLLVCAEVCIRQKTCTGFLYSDITTKCAWIPSSETPTNVDENERGDLEAEIYTASASSFMFYTKNKINTELLYDSQARSGMDFQPITGASILLHEGLSSQKIKIKILSDFTPELDEYFKVNIINVTVLDVDALQINQPTISGNKEAKITIKQNDNPYGLFTLHSLLSESEDNGKSINAEEKPQLSLEMVVERKGGTVGEVTVDWKALSGTALRDMDFTGDDATLKFGHGETKKVISISVIDDDIPELNEDINIKLSNPTGGAIVNPTESTVHVTILANDNAGGIVSFHPQSKSVIGEEGETIRLDLIRSDPAEGSCEVTWKIEGENAAEGVNATKGVVRFPPKTKVASLWLNLMADNTPEIKEEYTVRLVNALSIGIPETGNAAIDSSNSVSSITIKGSDEPHGVFRFSEMSQIADANELVQDLKLFVTRGFGSVGRVKVYFDVMPGTPSTLNPDIREAEPFFDFTYQSVGNENGKRYIVFEDGDTSVPIFFNIIDDDVPEMNEIFHVNLTKVVLIERAEGAINFIPPRVDAEHSLSQVVIDANDGTKGMINFQPDSLEVTAIEEKGRDVNVMLTVLREKGTYGEVTVFMFSQNGEAIAGDDFEFEAKTITFRDSQDKIDIPIKILDDDIPEGQEDFEVKLGNPSIGLEIGNATKATIRILSNDDAHGRLSFGNDRVIYIEEPDDHSVQNSKTELIITRNPKEGVFGEISVKYKIERENIADDAPVANDIFPVEGYIVIKDGVQTETLEITAVGDNEAELDETFVVTLSNPQGGAALSDDIATTIVIRANDSPYGRFKIVPKSQSHHESGIKVEEGPGVKIINFDIVREQGTLGDVFVAVKTRSGTAHSQFNGNSDASMLSVLQTFEASSMTSFLEFFVDSSQFLLALSSDRSGPLSTGVGSTGTISSLTPGVHTTLYKFFGLYTPVQTVETDGASAATSFVLDDGTYLFIANYGKYGRHETVSRLYKVSYDGSLKVVDEVPTKGATDVTNFHSNGVEYIVVANSMDNNQISGIDSYVYRFDKRQQKLTFIQTLPTRGASGVRTFTWDNDIYLAIANRRDTELKDNSIVSSVIYKWTKDENNVPSFTNRQLIDVSHATAVEVLQTKDFVYVICPSAIITGDVTRSHNVEKVEVFQVGFGEPQPSVTLKPHQTLNVSDVVSMRVQAVPSNMFNHVHNDVQDDTHLLAISSSKESLLYWLNPKSNMFEIITTTGQTNAILPIPTYSKHKNTTLMAIAVDTSEIEENVEFANTVIKSGIYYLSESNDSGDYLPIMPGLVLDFGAGKTSYSMAVTILDDDVPEKGEYFTVLLDNSVDTRADINKELGNVEVNILSNDDAHGVIDFSKNSIRKTVEETAEDNTFTLNLIRKPSAYGEVTIGWKAEGNLADISPLDGKVTFGDGQTEAGIQITIVADDIPEVKEIVEIILTEVVNAGNIRPHLGARINSSASIATINILPNDSPHGILRWSMTSLRNVIQEPETLSGATQLVTLELLREQGQLGDIQVFYETKLASNLPAKSQAKPGADYIARNDVINMAENVTRSTVAISIVPDDVPEDIESFYVVITDVKMIGQSLLDSRPGIGPPGAETAEIIIDENDHARGFVQFNVTTNSKDAVEAFEMPGTNTSFKLPLVRIVGAFRSVRVDWIANPMTAGPSDFYPHSGSVHFEEGQKNAFIEIFITDDNDVEFVEIFTVRLIGKPGGAKLGGFVSVTVNILPNDSPSGMFGFIQTSESVRESKSAYDPFGKVEFDVNRYQGSSADVTVSWSLEEDAFADLTPMSGKLRFGVDETMKTIVLRSLPDQILEGNEVYDIKLLDATNDAEISPVAGLAKVTIEADEGAAGTISIDSASTEILTAEPTVGYDGMFKILLHRGPGYFGDCNVRWQITPSDASTFYITEGEAKFYDLENETEIVIRIIDDAIPETSQTFMLRLISTTGGAKIDSNANSAVITVAASDSPHGTFSFSQPTYYVKEDGGNVTPDGKTITPSGTEDPTLSFLNTLQPHYVTSTASVTVIRNNGDLGEVSVTISTFDGTAVENEDYYGLTKKMIFANGESSKTIDVELLNDPMPEGPEQFCINITNVILTSHKENDYIAKGPHSIPLDVPPSVGDIPNAEIEIMKNDGAEGVITFPADIGKIEVDENNGTVQIPIVRLRGHYGEVSVTVKTVEKSAKQSVDYLAPTAGINVIFENKQTMAYAVISIIDDSEMEMAETFSVVLSGVNGGAKLGEHLIATVTIKKSDYPNGLLHFIEGGQKMTVRNPPSGGEGTKMNFILERTGGNSGEINAKWKIIRSAPFYGETSSSTPISEDIASPTSGNIQFPNGERGQREILITILPTSEEQEVEEHFAIVLLDVNPAEISETEGNITIEVSKKGNPNGIIKFSGEDNEIGKATVVQEPVSGSLQIVFPIERSEGTLGEVTLDWVVEPVNEDIGAKPEADLRSSRGEVSFRDGQSGAEVIIYVEADNEAELTEKFIAKLYGVNGGAEIDKNFDQREFIVQPNDNPHGVFAIFSSDQRISVLEDNTRVIVLNVTRQEGAFGRVVVSFTVRFNNPRGDSSYLNSDTGDVYIDNGLSWEVAEIPIISTAFLAVGDTFTITLISVDYMDNDVTILPKLSDQVQALVSVSDEAGNSQVGFESAVSNVYNSTRNAARMTIKRVGLYGDVTVNWVSGYPENRIITDIRIGQTMPATESIRMVGKQDKANATLTLFPNSVDAESFSAHISKVSSLVGGGAKIMPNSDITEFEPCGVVRFSTFSQHVYVSEDSSQVSLTVQRLYGSRYDIEVSYSTTPLTASPGSDFVPVTNKKLKINGGEQEAEIHIDIIKDDVPEMSKEFLVAITGATETKNFYNGLSPRVLESGSVSKVTIKESDDAHGVIQFDKSVMIVEENSRDGSSTIVVMITIKRTVGTFGEISVIMSTIGGGEEWEQDYLKDEKDNKDDVTKNSDIREYLIKQNERRATAGKDYEVRPRNVTFKEGQTQVQIPIVILDDDEAEPAEEFFVFLHSSTGSARLGKRIMKIRIPSNDYPNGRIGFSSQDGVKIYEDTVSRSLDLVVSRKAAFGNVTIKWRAVPNYANTGEGSSTALERMNVEDQLEVTFGEIDCPKGRLECGFTITLKNDEDAEFENWFLVEIYQVSDGAKINVSRRFVNVTMVESDFPNGLFQFSLQSRLPVVSKGNKAVSLTVERVGGHESESKVHFVTKELKSVINVASTELYPAVADVDYVKKQGEADFAPGQEVAFINIPLRSDTSSSNPLPQIFQVKLSHVTGDGSLNGEYDTANVTIVGRENTKRVWRVYEALQQNLNDGVIQSILSQLESLADEPMDNEQVKIFHGVLKDVINHGQRRRLPSYLQNNIYDLFCKLLDPHRSDAVLGYTEFGSTFEQFVFSLMTGMECKAVDSAIASFESCTHAALQSGRWYPEDINGRRFDGKRGVAGDYFELPKDLLDVQSDGVKSQNPTCYDIAFIEYQSQVWFNIHGEKGAMSNRIYSVSIKDKTMSTLVTPVRYRVHTTDSRISPKGAECVLWNEASKRWRQDPICHLKEDTDNYVDCECKHMSIYAARGPTDDLAGYNEATYVACFICAVAAAITILGHHVCAQHTTFASKLMMHMLFACGLTQLFFVVSTLTSENANEQGCAAIGIFLHYFWVAQFTWILVQAINIWKVLVMSNDNSSQVFTVFFILGWGIPVIIVGMHSVLMYALGFTALPQIYGDVHANGDICFVMNAKAALLSAVTPACFCIMITCTIGLQLYQRNKTWKQYDDMFRGRFNETEIPMLFWFFFLLAFSWLWGGLHLAYGQMWMLVLFILFNMIQGLYLLIVYGILHNQVIRGVKSPYETEGTGAQTVYATSTPGSQAPSVTGDVMNRSTQNLVGKGKDELDWGGSDPNFSRSRPMRNIDDSINNDDSADFDDLMFALKTGAVSEPEERIASLHNSPIKSTTTSQRSLRVIDDVIDDDINSAASSPRRDPSSYPIADTHL